MVDSRPGLDAERTAGPAADVPADPAADADPTFLPETAQPAAVVMPRLGAVGWARWAWRQLTSMRVALFLLLLLAVAAVPGSVFPQRRIDAGRVQTYLAEHTTTGPLLDRLGFFGVYTSPWFSAVYLLLFISLVGCVVPRTRKHLRAIRSVPPRTPRRLQRLPEYVTATAEATPEQVLERARAVLRRRRYRVAEHDGGSSLAAERGYLAETGNLVFHLALLALLVSVGAGAFTGYGGQALVVQGETFSNTLPMYNSFTCGRAVDVGDLPPFSFSLTDLQVQFETQTAGQLGSPRGFDATVSVRERPSDPAHTELVQVNHPLKVAGAQAYLVGNGYAPLVTVRDGNGDVAFRGAVPALVTDANYTSTIVIKAPDAKPRQLGISGWFLPTALLREGEGWVSIFPAAGRPRLVLTAFAAAPGQDGMGVNAGTPQSVYSLDVTNLQQLKDTDGQQARLLLAPGETVQLPRSAGSVTFEGVRRFATFDIRSDPTQGWALGSGLAALAAVTTSLFVRRRRVWVRVSAGEQGLTTVEVAGLARTEDLRLADEVRAVLDGSTATKG
jgi:cytochrome c biogenesis protein